MVRNYVTGDRHVDSQALLAFFLRDWFFSQMLSVCFQRKSFNRIIVNPLLSCDIIVGLSVVITIVPVQKRSNEYWG